MTSFAQEIWRSWLPKTWRHSDANRAKLEWLIRLRWLAVLSQGLCLIPGLRLEYLQTRFFYDFTGTVFFLVVFNLFSVLLAKKKETVTPGDLFLQLMIDLSGITILLLITGGAQNPLSALLFLHAGLGALVLSGRLGNLFFAYLAVCMGLLYWVPWQPAALKYGHVPRSLVFLSALYVAFVSWRLTAWFSGTLVSLQKHMDRLHDRKERMDRLRAVGALASGFSHEFATPLNTLQMRLNRLVRKPELAGDPDLRVALEAVDQCETALRSLNDSRIHSGALSMNTVSLSKTVGAVVENWKKDHPGVRISFRDTLEKEDALLLPQAAFSQVVLNLLDNAAESVRPGQATAQIEIEFAGEAQGFRLRVKDNGPGVPELVLRQWGEPFVTTKENGTGLGLFNALSFAQALGGEFSLQNLRDGGACAEFYLPRTESLT
jgi:two-component system sensor histidine kinase RegB